MRIDSTMAFIFNLCVSDPIKFLLRTLFSLSHICTFCLMVIISSNNQTRSHNRYLYTYGMVHFKNYSDSDHRHSNFILLYIVHMYTSVLKIITYISISTIAEQKHMPIQNKIVGLSDICTITDYEH